MAKLTMKDVKIGFIPISKFIFDREDTLKTKGEIEKTLKTWGVNYIGIDSLVKDGLIYEMSDIDPVVDFLKGQKIDAVFCPHCNFGTEGLVGLLGRKLGVPFLLWGPMDGPPLPNGARTRDTLCGLLASSKVLNKLEVPFTYIENCSIEDPAFEEGFHRFIRTAAVIKRASNLKIGQYGPRVDFFFTTIINESDLLNTFNVEIWPKDLALIITETKKRANHNKDKYGDEVKQMKRDFDLEGFSSDDQLVLLFALRDELLSIVEVQDLSAIAIQNIQTLVYELGVDQAWVYAVLNDMGIPVGTETDIHGAVSSALLQAAALDDGPTFLSDITVRHPENKNGFLLWHTSWPPSLADSSVKPKLGTHWLWRYEYPGMSHWKVKEGEMTLLRFDQEQGEYRMGIGEVSSIPGPYTQNNYVWVEAKDWKKWERKLIYGPYPHHISVAYGKYQDVLAEACKYLPGVALELFDE